MDSTAQTAPTPSEIFNETASTGDAWIRQRKKTMWAMKSSTKTESPQNQKSSTKLLPRVTHGLDIANSPCGHKNHQRKCFHGCRMDLTAQTAPATSEIFIKTASTGDTCTRQRKEPLWLQKSSTKLLPRVTHAFDSANRPWGLRNHQRKLSR